MLWTASSFLTGDTLARTVVDIFVAASVLLTAWLDILARCTFCGDFGETTFSSCFTSFLCTQISRNLERGWVLIFLVFEEQMFISGGTFFLAPLLVHW